MECQNENGSGANIFLISPEWHNIHCALRFGFQVSNNEVEYEALIVGLRLAKALKVNNLKVYNDSKLVVNQVNETYQAIGEKMVTYWEKMKELIGSISTFTIKVVPRLRNSNADGLAKLASTKDVELLNAVSIEFLSEPSCYIPDFCMAILASEFMVELSVYVCLILMRKYICENCYVLEFMI